MVRVQSAQPISDHEVALTFTDGRQGVLNLRDIMDFGPFQQLRDPQFFQQVSVAFGTLCWGEALDLDPEYVIQHTRFTSSPPTRSAGHDRTSDLHVSK